MKKLLLFALAVFIAVPSFTQVNFGIKAGLSTTSITMDDVKTITTSNNASTYTVDAVKEANYGFHAGAFLRLALFNFYVQPELLFASTEHQYNVTNVTAGTASVLETQKFNKLDIPVMLGAKIGPFRINAGPSASLLINSPGTLIDNPEFDTMYKRMSFGYQAGIGVDILKTLTVDLRYEGSLRKYQNQLQNLAGTTFNLDDRPNAFLLSVGLMF